MEGSFIFGGGFVAITRVVVSWSTFEFITPAILDELFLEIGCSTTYRARTSTKKGTSPGRILATLLTFNFLAGTNWWHVGKLWPLETWRIADVSTEVETLRKDSSLVTAVAFFSGLRSILLVGDFFYGLYHDKSSSHYQFGKLFWFFKLIFYGRLTIMVYSKHAKKHA